MALLFYCCRIQIAAMYDRNFELKFFLMNDPILKIKRKKYYN
jgi:hypothetical protein